MPLSKRIFSGRFLFRWVVLPIGIFLWQSCIFKAASTVFAQISLEKGSVVSPPFKDIIPQTPAAIAVGPLGNLVLLDARLATILKLGRDGKLLGQIGGPGSGVEQFSAPADLCVLSGLDVFVADRGNDRIVRLDRQLHYLAEYRAQEGTSADLVFDNPLSVVLTPRGDLFIADGGNDRILKLDPSGREVFSFGAYGEEKESLTAPFRLELDPRGGIWVLDARGKVSHFDEYGGYLESLMAQLRGSPTGLAVSANYLWVTSDSLIWVVDRKGRTVRVFDPQMICDPPASAIVDAAFWKDTLWLLDKRGWLYSFTVVSER
ncbi:MAG: NHL repeat-containing protein [bacterium]